MTKKSETEYDAHYHANYKKNIELQLHRAHESHPHRDQL